MWEERIEFTLTVCLCADRSANKLKQGSVTKWLTVITLTYYIPFPGFTYEFHLEAFAKDRWLIYFSIGKSRQKPYQKEKCAFTPVEIIHMYGIYCMCARSMHAICMF